MNATRISSSRRYDIDWLRVLLILTVFVFHSLRFFDLDDWHVKNPATYMGVMAVIVYLSRWMMPLIFFVSGVATFYALGKRQGAGKFIKDRSLRLLVPLVVGLFTHVALQEYLEAISHHQYSGSFWQWYPTMFNGLRFFGGNFNWIGNHLWYLEALSIFSLITLPLLLWLRHGAGQRALAWLGDHLSTPGTVYLLALPTLLLTFVLNPDSSLLTNDGFGGWSLPNHMGFFLSGFLFASSESLKTTIHRVRWISLAAAIVTFIFGIGLYVAVGEVPFGTPFYLLLMLFSSLTCWTWMLAILGFSMERLNVHTPSLDYANEMVMPFYIFHQSVLLAVGFFVVRWAIPDLAKWAIITASSFILIIAACEFVVRRSNLLRFLFGMKPVHKEKRLPEPAAQVS